MSLDGEESVFLEKPSAVLENAALLSMCEIAQRHAGVLKTIFHMVRLSRKSMLVAIVCGALVVIFEWLWTTPERIVLSQDFAELHQACANNTWREGLYVNATLSSASIAHTDAAGYRSTLAVGLNNLRSEFAAVLKWAFDAGAGLVLPRILLRDRKTLGAWAKHAQTSSGPEHFFDIDRLRRQLAVICPQMRFREAFDTKNIAAQPADVPRRWRELTFARGLYRQHFNDILAYNNITAWSRQSNVIVQENLVPMSSWDYRADDVRISNAWFDLLHWAPHLQEISNTLLRSPLLTNGFIGIHLRTEGEFRKDLLQTIGVPYQCTGDVMKDWPKYDEQVAEYSFWLNRRTEKTIVLACGNVEDVAKFRHHFPEHLVLTKWDLVGDRPQLVARLGQLDFDEMAAVDYELMRPASFVMGIGHSTFAYFLGIDRRTDRGQHFASLLDERRCEKTTLHSPGTN